MDKKVRNLIELHIATIILASNGVFAKLIPLSSSLIVFWRSLIGALALGAFLSLRKKKFRLESAREYFAMVFLGVLVGVHWVAFFYAIQVSNVAIGYLSLFTYPVMTAFLEPLLNNERFQKTDVFSAVLVFIGVLVIIPKMDISNAITQGIFWGVFSGFLYAVRNIYSRKYVKKYSSPLVMLYQLVVTAIILTPALSDGMKYQPQDWVLLLILGVLCTAFGHTLLANSLEYLKAKTIGIVGSLQVPYSIIFAALLLYELPSIETLIGGSIIMTAVILEMRKQKPRKSFELAD